MKAGQPSIPAAIRLANFFDVPLEYLVDDSVPVTTPAPKKWEFSSYKVLESAKSMGLTLEEVEEYLLVTKIAITLKIRPKRALKLMASADVEQKHDI